MYKLHLGLNTMVFLTCDFEIHGCEDKDAWNCVFQVALPECSLSLISDVMSSPPPFSSVSLNKNESLSYLIMDGVLKGSW